MNWKVTFVLKDRTFSDTFTGVDTYFIKGCIFDEQHFKISSVDETVYIFKSGVVDCVICEQIPEKSE